MTINPIWCFKRAARCLVLSAVANTRGNKARANKLEDWANELIEIGFRSASYRKGDLNVALRA